jgi:hypothetical protein
MSNAVSR